MLNKLIVIGRLTRDPESFISNSGITVTKFTVVTNEKFKDKETSEFHNMVAFGRVAEVCAQYLVKGKLVYVEGRLQTSNWITAEGEKRYKTEVIVSLMKMLTNKVRKLDGDEASSSRTSSAPERFNNDEGNDDIPF